VFESNKVGTLIHPFLGAMEIVIEKWSVTESSIELFICNFSIDFIIKTQTQLLTDFLDPSYLDVTFEEILIQEKNLFSKFFDMAKDFNSQIQKMVLKLENVIKRIQSIKSQVVQSAEFINSAKTLYGKLESIVYNSVSLGNELINLLTFQEVPFGATSAVNTLLSLMNQTTFHKEILELPEETENDLYMKKLLLHCNEAYTLRILSEASFISKDEIKEHSTIISYIEDRLISEVNAPHKNITKLQIATLNILNQKAIQLPRVVEIDNANNSNLLTLCYELYGEKLFENTNALLKINKTIDGSTLTRKLKVLSNE
jgi:prophage DNA circulation protein